MRPDDLLGTFCYLLSDDSPFVSGQTILVNGGRVPTDRDARAQARSARRARRVRPGRAGPAARGAPRPSSSSEAIERLEAVDGSLNAVIHRQLERAMADAAGPAARRPVPRACRSC